MHSVIWNYIWAGKFPSTHAAVLSGVLYAIWYEDGPSLLFGFCVIVSSLFIYIYIENKKRYHILESYFSKSNDTAIKNIILDKRLDEFDGHTVLEIIAGVVLGTVTAIVVIGVLS